MRLALPALFALPLALALSACAQFPELDRAVTPEMERASIPQLRPLAPLLARAQANSGPIPDTAADLSPRLATLRARAAGLRGPVIPPAVRARMLRGIR